MEEAKVTETMMKENTTNVVGQNKSLRPGPLPKGLHSKLPTHSVPGQQLQATPSSSRSFIISVSSHK